MRETFNDFGGDRELQDKGGGGVKRFHLARVIQKVKPGFLHHEMPPGVFSTFLKKMCIKDISLRNLERDDKESVVKL